MKTVSILGSAVAATDYSRAIDWILEKAAKADRAYAVEAANAHVLALSRHDPSFGETMRSFDLILPDGMPLVWSINALLPEDQKLKDRVYGPTLMLKTFEATQSELCSYRHFLLGGKESTLEKLNDRFSNEFPNSSICGSYSPPFGKWSDNETKKIKEMIKGSNANLVWVGLGCPKQEHWIASNLNHLPPAVYFGIGAAFAFHAGEVKQAPFILQKIGLEWLYRLSMEPRRLFQRYFIYNSLFLYYSLLDRIRTESL